MTQDDEPALGRYSPDDASLGPVVAVRLLDVPVRVWKRAAEHHDELMREMALLALGPDMPHDLPQRLVELVELLGRKYAGASARPELERDAALAAGIDRVDITFEVPTAAGEAAATLGAMLAEAEEFCRDGDRLLTLAQPQVQSDFGVWYLEQFVNQIAGGAPVAWPGPWD